jgi:hypothetical protein
MSDIGGLFYSCKTSFAGIESTPKRFFGASVTCERKNPFFVSGILRAQTKCGRQNV